MPYHISNGGSVYLLNLIASLCFCYQEEKELQMNKDHKNNLHCSPKMSLKKIFKRQFTKEAIQLTKMGVLKMFNTAIY